MRIFESHGNFDVLIKKYKLNIVIAKLVIILLCFLSLQMLNFWTNIW
jgi:hypothetical protein